MGPQTILLPDLPKGYQISQYDLPFSDDGALEIDLGPDSGEKRKIGIIRAPLEEDAGKNMHDESGQGTDSQVDLNRAGTLCSKSSLSPTCGLPPRRNTILKSSSSCLLTSKFGLQHAGRSLRCDATSTCTFFRTTVTRSPLPSLR